MEFIEYRIAQLGGVDEFLALVARAPGGASQNADEFWVNTLDAGGQIDFFEGMDPTEVEVLQALSRREISPVAPSPAEEFSDDYGADK